METSTTRSYCSYYSRCNGHSGHGMQGSALQHSLSDGLLLVLCI